MELATLLKSAKDLIFPPSNGIEFEDLSDTFQRKPLSDLLLATAYDEKLGCYICRDNTIGFIFECFPKQLAGEDTIKTLQDIFSSVYLPQGTAIQVTMWADDYLEPFMDSFKRLRQNENGKYTDEKSQFWVETMYDFILSLKRKGPLDIMQVPARNFKMFFSIKIPENIETYQDRTSEIGIAIKNISTSLEAASLWPETITPEKYVRILNLMYCPNHSRDGFNLYDENAYIYNQIVDADTEMLVGRNAVKYDGVYGKAYTIKQFPEEVTIVDAMSFIGDAFRNELQIACPFMLTLNLSVQGDEIKTKQSAKAEFLHKQKIASGLSIKLQKKQEEAAWLIEKIVDNNKLLKGHLVWWLYHDDYDVVYKSGQVLKSMLNMRGYKIQEEIKAMNLALFLAATPLNFNTEVDEKLLKRSRTMFDFNAAHLSPVQADWKGTGTPVVPLLSRHGQLAFFSLFDGPEGSNACVAAKTGSGKSYFVNFFIWAYLSIPNEPRKEISDELSAAMNVSNIWVIDVGESYKTLCNYCGGSYLDFKEDPAAGETIVINPFSECQDINEDMDLFIALISKMAKPTEQITDTEKSIIEEAIKTTFIKYTQETNIDKLIDALRKIADNAGDLIKKDAAILIATNLYRWSTQGVFGKFFNGKNNIDIKHKFVVLELKRLAHREDLRNVVLMVLFYHIYRVVYIDDDRSKKKILIFDEAWQFFDDPNIAKFIEKAYRTFRKHGSSVMTITQGIHDFYKNTHTQEMLFQSAHWMLLAQKQESINMLKSENRVAFNDYEFDQISSLKTIKGSYSEIFFNTPYGRGILRLVVPRIFNWIATTDAEEASKRDELIKKYGLEEGLNQCIKLYD